MTRLVVAGIHVENARLLLARRPLAGSLPGLWEFPGGKVEEGETPEAALVREWREELGVRPAGLVPYAFVTTPTREGDAVLLFFSIRALAGSPRPLGVDAVRRARADEARLLALVPADVPVLQRLLRDGAGVFLETGDDESPALAARAAEEDPHILGSENLGDGPLSFAKVVAGRRLEGFVVRAADGVRAYENLCPHVPIPLDRPGEGVLSEDGRTLVCRNHGAVFRTDTGLCTSGPCAGDSLRPLPLRASGAGWALADEASG